jgi:hypothetical protein
MTHFTFNEDDRLQAVHRESIYNDSGPNKLIIDMFNKAHQRRLEELQSKENKMAKLNKLLLLKALYELFKSSRRNKPRY